MSVRCLFVSFVQVYYKKYIYSRCVKVFCNIKVENPFTCLWNKTAWISVRTINPGFTCEAKHKKYTEMAKLSEDSLIQVCLDVRDFLCI